MLPINFPVHLLKYKHSKNAEVAISTCVFTDLLFVDLMLLWFNI